MAWAISPIFIRRGLNNLASPLLGVTVGMFACTLAYGLALFFRASEDATPIPPQALLLQIGAGALVGLSTWARWIALDLAQVAVVLALGRISVPVVLILSPFLVGKKLERVTMQIWVGAILIVAGSLLIVFYR